MVPFLEDVQVFREFFSRGVITCRKMEDFHLTKPKSDEVFRTLLQCVIKIKNKILFFANYILIMEDVTDFTLDRSAIDTLSSDTRIRILSSLRGRRKTNAELARELSLAAPTIRHHLEQLKEAGLIEAQEDGHKWVYFQLTPLGSALFNPDKRVRFSIILSSVLTFCTALAAVITYLILPRLDTRPWYPGFDDPFLPLFIVAGAAVVMQAGILAWVFWERKG